MPLKWHRGEPSDDSYSFDRKDSSLGYVKDNLEIMSVLANRAKNNLTMDELKKFSATRSRPEWQQTLTLLPK